MNNVNIQSLENNCGLPTKVMFVASSDNFDYYVLLVNDVFENTIDNYMKILQLDIIIGLKKNSVFVMAEYTKLP